jgi:Taurine catabolism dioxygenase TauD, TfdA family
MVCQGPARQRRVRRPSDGLPFNARLGDGDRIGEDVMQLLNEVHEANSAREPWQTGDLMLVDNIRTGDRRMTTIGSGGPAGGVLALRPGSARPRGRKYVYDEVVRSGELHVIDDFFHELRRYG